jgi:hypothetical protein
MVSSIFQKNEHWDNFQYIKISQRLFFGKFKDTINCFWDLLTFSINYECFIDIQWKSRLKCKCYFKYYFPQFVLCGGHFHVISHESCCTDFLEARMPCQSSQFLMKVIAVLELDLCLTSDPLVLKYVFVWLEFSIFVVCIL